MNLIKMLNILQNFSEKVKTKEESMVTAESFMGYSDETHLEKRF